MHQKQTQITDLKERITLLYPKVLNDKQGGYTTSWKSGKSLWAMIVRINSSTSIHESVLREAQSLPGMRYKIRIRAGHVVSLPGRVKWFEKILTITTKPNLDSSRCWIDFLACDVEKGDRG